MTKAELCEMYKERKKKMEFKSYLVSYFFKRTFSKGTGYGTFDANFDPLTKDGIDAVVNDIKRRGRFKEVVILNIIPLNDDLKENET